MHTKSVGIREEIVADHYEAEVSEGYIEAAGFTGELNDRWEQGWKLSRLLQQGGNTIIVWERRGSYEARERFRARGRRSRGQGRHEIMQEEER